MGIKYRPSWNRGWWGSAHHQSCTKTARLKIIKLVFTHTLWPGPDMGVSQAISPAQNQNRKSKSPQELSTFPWISWETAHWMRGRYFKYVSQKQPWASGKCPYRESIENNKGIEGPSANHSGKNSCHSQNLAPAAQTIKHETFVFASPRPPGMRVLTSFRGYTTELLALSLEAGCVYKSVTHIHTHF